MDLQKLEALFNEIVGRRNELSQLSYSDEKYDQLEDEVHDLEDDFSEEYGEVLEDLLGDIHEEMKIDTEVLLPVSYILSRYEEVNGQIDVNVNNGVAIESEDYPGCNTRLMFLPDPMRLAFTLEGSVTKEWEIKKELSNS